MYACVNDMYMHACVYVDKHACMSENERQTEKEYTNVIK